MGFETNYISHLYRVSTAFCYKVCNHIRQQVKLRAVYFYSKLSPLILAVIFFISNLLSPFISTPNTATTIYLTKSASCLFLYTSMTSLWSAAHTVIRHKWVEILYLILCYMWMPMGTAFCAYSCSNYRSSPS